MSFIYSPVPVSTGGGGGGGSTALTASCTFITGNYTLPTPTCAETFVFVHTSHANITATLPALPAGAQFPIHFVDCDGSGSTNNFLISPSSSLTTIALISSSYTYQANFGSIGFISGDAISWQLF